MKVFRLLLVATTVAATVVTGASSAQAAPAKVVRPAHVARPAHAAKCSMGNLNGSFRHGLTVKGTCTIPGTANVTVRGSLRLDKGAMLNIADGAHLRVLGQVTLGMGSAINAITASTVTIRGPVSVGDGAKLALGCSVALTQPPGALCTGVSHDTVWGSITSWGGLVLQLDGVTVRGNITWIGGGQLVTDPTCIQKPGSLNFAVKDNVVRGRVLVAGWQGCWIGYIRNMQRGNAVFVGNTTADPDSMEVVTNSIWGNLACYANSPAAQLGDSGGTKNMVTGVKLGQCSSL